MVRKPKQLIVSIKKRGKLAVKKSERSAATVEQDRSRRGRLGILDALQRVVWKRSKPAADRQDLPSQIPDESAVEAREAASAEPALPAKDRGAVQNEIVYHPPESSSEDEEKADDGTTVARRKGSRWVPKLLVPTEKPRDRIHKKKRKPQVPVAPHAPALLTVASSRHVELLARMLAFLDPYEPAATCSRINNVVAAGVRAYYQLFCSQPRPHRYLLHRIFHDPQAPFLRHIHGYLSPAHRVRDSAVCRSFLQLCDALPLEVTGDRQALEFVRRLSPPRVETRYGATTSLHLCEYHCQHVSSATLGTINKPTILISGHDGQVCQLSVSTHGHWRGRLLCSREVPVDLAGFWICVEQWSLFCAVAAGSLHRLRQPPPRVARPRRHVGSIPLLIPPDSSTHSCPCS